MAYNCCGDSARAGLCTGGWAVGAWVVGPSSRLGARGPGTDWLWCLVGSPGLPGMPGGWTAQSMELPASRGRGGDARLFAHSCLSTPDGAESVWSLRHLFFD